MLPRERPAGVPLCPELIGREDLLALADRRLHAARAGSGHLLFFAGEAGIGKTRLLTEVCQRAGGAGFAVVTVGAHPRDAEVAGGLLADLATTLRRPWHPSSPTPPPSSPSAAPALSPTTRRLTTPSPSVHSPSVHSPSVHSVHSPTTRPAAEAGGRERAANAGNSTPSPTAPTPATPLPDGAAGEERAWMTDAGERIAQRLTESGGGDRGDAHRQRRLLAAELTEAVLSIGGDRVPLLLALEDLHWADDLTLEVLDRVAARLRSLPMLVVGTYRSDELYPRVPMRAWRSRLLTQRRAEEARLPRLGAAQTAAMAAAIADGVVPAAVAAAVHDRSDGIPLHVEEFLAIIGDGRRGVPDTLADAVLTRAEALSAPARELAGAASVIGRSFDLDLLTAVTGQPPEGIDAALRELVERFFVRARGDAGEYDFRHALIRDALYADLTPHRRRALHGRAADAAVAAGFGDAFVSDQFERAHRPAEAYRHALAAAAEATGLSAHREAVQLYRRAQRTTPTGTAGADRARLLAALAAELAAIDDNAAAAACYAEAYELHRRLGADAAAAALVPPLVSVRHLLGASLQERVQPLLSALSFVDRSEPRARILAALSAAFMLDRRLEEAIDYGERARVASAGLSDRSVRLDTDSTLGAVLVFAGRMDEGWALMEAAVAAAGEPLLEAEAARAYRMLGSSSSVLVEYERALRWTAEGIAYTERTERFNDRHYLTAHRAHVLWATGDWTGAEREANQALADGRGGVTTRITALHVLGYLALGRGDGAAAQRHLRDARLIGAQMGELQRLSPALWGLAESALRAGRFEEAVEWCEQGYAASAAVRDAAYVFPYLVTGARAKLALDDLTAARDWVDRVEDLLLLRRIPGTLPALPHARGLLHLAAGHTGRARDALAEAGAGWDARRRFWEGTQSLLDRARAADRSRRPAEAAALTAEARARAAATGAAALGVAPAAGGVAGADGGGGRRGVEAEAQLTAREIEVARLVAKGATNREIAAALSISPKTVAAHVEHILTKLGAARRTEIAAWASTRHLTRPHP